jgi:4a-hydroxytetrahydrobiopterin dehydratase
MTEALVSKTCTPCRGGIPPLTREQAELFHAQAPEAEGHHPNISFGWGNATVSLQTKKIKGLHENDFIMATKIDRIFARTATA